MALFKAGERAHCPGKRRRETGVVQATVGGAHRLLCRLHVSRRRQRSHACRSECEEVKRPRQASKRTPAGLSGGGGDRQVARAGARRGLEQPATCMGSQGSRNERQTGSSGSSGHPDHGQQARNDDRRDCAAGGAGFSRSKSGSAPCGCRAARWADQTGRNDLQTPLSSNAGVPSTQRAGSGRAAGRAAAGAAAIAPRALALHAPCDLQAPHPAEAHRPLLSVDRSGGSASGAKH